MAVLRILLVLAALAVTVLALVGITTWMPGRSYAGPAAGAEGDGALRERLERHVHTLSVAIGERNTRHPGQYDRAAQYLEAELSAMGYRVERQTYRSDGMDVHNLIAELPGASRPKEVVVIGGHYDSVWGTPGADDNASGTAATIELARAFAGAPLPRTVRFVLFANEEPPAFQNEDMGSLVYAKACKARGDDVVAMISLESIGFFTSVEGTQQLPTPLLRPFLGTTGDFLGFVSDWRSRALVKETIRLFRETGRFPSEGISAPEWVSGIGFSDHWSFWQVGYPAVMVTDTALFRNPHYHQATDLPGTLDFAALTRITRDLEPVVRGLASSDARW